MAFLTFFFVVNAFEAKTKITYTNDYDTNRKKERETFTHSHYAKRKKSLTLQVSTNLILIDFNKSVSFRLENCALHAIVHI